MDEEGRMFEGKKTVCSKAKRCEERKAYLRNCKLCEMTIIIIRLTCLRQGNDMISTVMWDIVFKGFF